MGIGQLVSYQLELVGAAGGGVVAAVVAGGVVGRRASGEEEQQQDGGDRGQEELAAAEDRHGPSRRSWGGLRERDLATLIRTEGRKEGILVWI